MWRHLVRVILGGLFPLLLGMPAAQALPAPDQLQAFDVQRTPPYDFVRPVGLLEMNLFGTPESRIQELRARGVTTICHVNAGAWESWRPDSRDYPDAVVGRKTSGWPGERWVDVRRLDALAPILGRRLDLCKSKGFDGVAVDNLDGYAKPTGFALAARNQLDFNRWLAAEARGRGLVVGLKNDLDQVPELVDHFDFAVSESCFEAGTCDRLRPFQDAGKPVYAIEYTNVRRKMDRYCLAAAGQGVQLIFKAKSLNAKLHRRCPG